MDRKTDYLNESVETEQKLEDKSISALTETELLSKALSPEELEQNPENISSKILQSYSLARLPEKTLEDLRRLDGLSDTAANRLIALGELTKRMQKQTSERIESFSDVKIKVRDMRNLDNEELRVFLLSSDNELLKEERFGGRIDSVNFSFRSVFREAVREDASAIVMAHNHPSGYSRPTEKDLETTQEMVELGKKLNINVLDHIVVGDEISSMRDESCLEFFPKAQN